MSLSKVETRGESERGCGEHETHGKQEAQTVDVVKADEVTGDYHEVQEVDGHTR